MLMMELTRMELVSTQLLQLTRHIPRLPAGMMTALEA